MSEQDAVLATPNLAAVNDTARTGLRGRIRRLLIGMTVAVALFLGPTATASVAAAPGSAASDAAVVVADAQDETLPGLTSYHYRLAHGDHDDAAAAGGGGATGVDLGWYLALFATLSAAAAAATRLTKRPANGTPAARSAVADAPLASH